MAMYSTKEAAARCDREHSHVRRLCKQLGIGTVKGGRRTLTEGEVRHLQKWVREHGNENKRLKAPYCHSKR